MAWNKKHIENIKICALADLREGNITNFEEAIKKYKEKEDYELCEGVRQAFEEFNSSKVDN